MRIKSLSLGLSAGLITAIGFGICGVFFAVAPGPTSAALYNRLTTARTT